MINTSNKVLYEETLPKNNPYASLENNLFNFSVHNYSRLRSFQQSNKNKDNYNTNATSNTNNSNINFTNNSILTNITGLTSKKALKAKATTAKDLSKYLYHSNNSRHKQDHIAPFNNFNVKEDYLRTEADYLRKEIIEPNEISVLSDNNKITFNKNFLIDKSEVEGYEGIMHSLNVKDREEREVDNTQEENFSILSEIGTINNKDTQKQSKLDRVEDSNFISITNFKEQKKKSNRGNQEREEDSLFLVNSSSISKIENSNNNKKDNKNDYLELQRKELVNIN
eukprot:CAMPEP_0170524502 /NCGR_PEP_ID=MMETSP0209-20121228/9945_1 /TAXON_ID=665100 ORGANISM="Litonotus pictus, Strain P1" /NCGR_SAMPLE_ID=MMETSP0209 /ASSEMBLY_ACC=CAM_ASM_000301 /LENGTH=281 /DNA_ID=CAMNT_0010813213 /DNA_START=274 /DNA_END=1116 /DNA_ORIENTATION=+